MGISIVADRNRAVFVQNTSEQAFGPAIRVAGHGRLANQKVAELVLKKCDGSLCRLWSGDPDAVRRYIVEAKRELYPDAAPEVTPDG